MVYEYDALDLLATCTSLETLNIGAGIQCLKPDSPGLFALRKIQIYYSLSSRFDAFVLQLYSRSIAGPEHPSYKYLFTKVGIHRSLLFCFGQHTYTS